MRFHFGISFRWNTIKKFLFPFLIGLLTYFGFSSGIFENLHLPFLTLTKVHAYSNYDTQFNVDIPDYNELLASVSCGENGTMLDSVKYIIDEYNDQYFHLFVGSPSEDGTQIAFYITRYPVITQYKASYYGYLNGSTKRVYFKQLISNPSGSTPVQPYYLLTSSNCSTFKNSTGYTNFKYIYNNNLTSNYYPSSGDGLVTSNDTVPVLEFDVRQDLPSMSNSSSYDTNLWFYYTTQDLSLGEGVSSSYYYYKKVCLVDNDTCYNYGDTLPSYTDLYGFDIPIEPTTQFIDYKNYLGAIYSNFSPNDLSNFEIKLNFDTYGLSALQYTQNLDYTNQCYGRINHGNYYSYEKFPMCSVAMDFGTGVVLDSNQNKLVFNDLLIADSNGNVINNFSNYDKLFIYIDFNYNDPSLNKTISNMSLISTQNVYYEDDFRGPIYENFDSLGSYFKMLISTSKNSKSSFYAKSISSSTTTNDFINTQYYNTTTLQEYEVNGFLSDSWKNFNVNNYNSTSLMLFQQINSLNSGILNPSIHLVIFQDIVISINNISNNTFYYVNSSGNIESNVIEVDYASSNNQSFDLSYYFYEFNNYLDSISDQCLTLHNITQDFYDSTPEFFRVSIFIIFILFCISFLYREIRR